MVQAQQTNMGNLYSQAFKSWADMLSSWTEAASNYPGAFSGPSMETWFKPWSEMVNTWTKTMTSIHPEEFGKAGLDNWFKPYWDYMDNWNKAYQGFADATKSSPVPLESMKQMNQNIAKAINAYVHIHDAWIRSMDAATRQGYEIGRRLMAGEEVELGTYLDTLKSAYEESASSLMEALKETPFAEMQNIDAELRNSLEAFPEEQEAAKNLLEELVRFNSRMMNISTSGMKEASATLTNMMENGTISVDSYKSIMDAYAETLKQCLEIMKPPTALLPGHKIMVDAVIGCAEKNLDMMTAWLEINLKLYEGIGKASGEITKSTSEIFKDNQNLTPDEFYKKWVQAWDESTRALIQNTDIATSVPAFLRKYTDCVKAMENAYETASAVPYATKEEVDSLAYEVEKVKSSLAKKSKAEQ